MSSLNAPTPRSVPLPQASLPKPPGFLETSRTDRWWLQPLLVLGGLGLFIIYSTWAAFQGAHYYLRDGGGTYEAMRNYLSPMYSPTIFESPKLVNGVQQYSGHAWFGPWPEWLMWMPALFMTPAILILWAPGLFRFTCYYYRGAYYKAFWGDPTNCAVGEPGARGKNYRGERWFPLVFQNIHRYALYLAMIFLIVLTYDAILAYIFFVPDATSARGYRSTFGVGVGSLILTLNPILLGGYTLGCHSLRHLVGGRFDQMSRHPTRKKAYDCVTCLNRRHMMWAWASLIWVAFCDVYVRMCSMGIWYDYRLL
jgi:hypothetical protein